MTGETDPDDDGADATDAGDDRPDASEAGQYPTVPTEQLESGGWSLRDTRVEVRARVAGVVARAHERRYEDDHLREQVRAAGGPDHLWRLFYATRLTFTPSLPPGIGPAMALPKVRSAANDEFTDQLREEGLIEVERGDDEHLDVDSGARAKLTRYDATLPVETDDGECEVPMGGWIASWHDDCMLLAGGLYPKVPLTEVFGGAGLVDDPETSRAELRSLLRQVEC